ncbi:MAG: P44/Msp2 family outer membrane protein [Hyphomicrobium sp.]
MKVRTACLSMGLATGLATALALLGAVQTATAADFSKGGIKDYGGAGGVPVPAPVPIAVTAAEWYIGIVGGGVLSDESTIEECCTSMSVIESDGLAKTMFGGISIGRYFTSSIRGEVAFDFYDDFKVTNPGEQFYTDAKSAESTYTTPAGGTTYDTQHYDVTRTDIVKVGRSTGMLNLYYDLNTGTRFRPYVGGGVGVTWRQMTRKWKEDAECNHTTNTFDNTLPTNSCVRTTTDLPATYSESGSDTVDRFDIALAAMAGLSVEITPDIMWDNGYQMLWESNSIQLTTPSHCGSCDSTVTYGDTIQHQFRTGLRFNVN